MLHDAAGLAIAANVAIPGLPAAVAPRSPDICIHAGSRPLWADFPVCIVHTSSCTTDDGSPVVTVGRAEHGFHFGYADGTQVWIDTAGTEIWCTDAPGATLADTATYLTGPILGFALRRRGSLALFTHAE